MSNTYESNVEHMINELENLKENTINANVLDLNRSQVSVKSLDSVKTVIQINVSHSSRSLQGFTNEINL